MSRLLSTRQAAKKLGIDVSTLSRHLASGKIPLPEISEIGGKKVHAWTEQQVETVRRLLPKIANGRKTWRQKKKEAAKKNKKK